METYRQQPGFLLVCQPTNRLKVAVQRGAAHRQRRVHSENVDRYGLQRWYPDFTRASQDREESDRGVTPTVSPALEFGGLGKQPRRGAYTLAGVPKRSAAAWREIPKTAPMRAQLRPFAFAAATA